MLFPYLIKVSFLLGLLTLSYRWLIQYETFSKLNRVLLIFNVAAAWTLPLIPIATWGPVQIQEKFQNTAPELVKAVPYISNQLPLKVLSSFHSSSVGSGILDFTEWLFVIYIAGFGVIALYFVLQILKMFIKLWKLPSERLDNGVVIILDQSTTSPYSLFKWIICNPANHAELELKHILAHETEHVLQGHSFDLLLAECQRIVLWFNPFSWFHRRLVQENLEYLADSAVLQHGFERKQYQFNLLKIVMQTNELPLTNSFAKSLLKKRIKMMNRKPSNFWVAGKYASLMGLLYFSSAFVAPYKERLITLTPAVIKPAVEVLLSENNFSKQLNKEEPDPSIALQDVAQKTKELKITLDSAQVLTAKKSRWFFERNGSLYWCISPLATLDDINEIRQEIKKFGGEMNINAIAYDPLQAYITTLTVDVKSKGAHGRANEKEDNYTPMKGVGGYITSKGNLGMGYLADEPLGIELKKDLVKANQIKEENEVQYFAERLKESLREQHISASSATYPSSSFESEIGQKMLENIGIGKSSENTLLVTPVNRHAADYYLNTKQVSFEGLNSVSFDLVEFVTIIKDQIGRKYILVRTK